MTNVAPKPEGISITEFRDNLGPNLDKVQHTGARLLVTRKGRKAVAVVPMDAFVVLKDAEYAAEFAATVRGPVTHPVTGFNNVTLEDLSRQLLDMASQIGQPSVELAGGDAAAIALVLTEYRAAHMDSASLRLVVEMLLRRLGVDVT